VVVLLAVQILAGIAVYAALALLLRLESASYLMEMARKLLRRK